MYCGEDRPAGMGTSKSYKDTSEYRLGSHINELYDALDMFSKLFNDYNNADTPTFKEMYLKKIRVLQESIEEREI